MSSDGTYVARLGPIDMTPEEAINHALLHGSLELKQIAAIADELLEAVKALQFILDANDIDHDDRLPLQWA